VAKRFFWFLALCVLAGCGAAPSGQPLIEAAAAWARFDSLFTGLLAAPTYTDIEPAVAALRQFDQDLERLSSSRNYQYYGGRIRNTGGRPPGFLSEELQTALLLPAHITELSAELRHALEQGDIAGAVKAASLVRSSLSALLRFDNFMGNIGADSLFWLFITLLLIITIMTVFLCSAYIQLKKTRIKEEELWEFSKAIMQGQEIERRRIALELHDSALQDLRGIHGAEAASEKIRSICTELIPPDFEDLNFDDSLTSLCESFEKRTGIACKLNIDARLITAPLNAAALLHMYRMVEEALRNIEKHACAHTAIVVARNTDRDGLPQLLICISDDGKGLSDDFPGSGKTPPGFGLRGMKERANILGARLDFKSENGEGLMVRIEAPLHE